MTAGTAIAIGLGATATATAVASTVIAERARKKAKIAKAPVSAEENPRLTLKDVKDYVITLDLDQPAEKLKEELNQLKTKVDAIETTTLNTEELKNEFLAGKNEINDKIANIEMIMETSNQAIADIKRKTESIESNTETLTELKMTMDEYKTTLSGLKEEQRSLTEKNEEFTQRINERMEEINTQARALRTEISRKGLTQTEDVELLKSQVKKIIEEKDELQKLKSKLVQDSEDALATLKRQIAALKVITPQSSQKNNTGSNLQKTNQTGFLGRIFNQ